jgi:hypothetical protein
MKSVTFFQKNKSHFFEKKQKKIKKCTKNTLWDDFFYKKIK